MSVNIENLKFFSAACAECPIRERAVCSRCEPDELARLEKFKFYRSYSAGQTIAMRGDEMKTISSVVTGTATLTRAMEDGRTQMVGLLLPSDFLGHPGRDLVPYDVTAITDVTLCSFHKGPFEKMAAETQHLGERMLEMALDELDAARDWMLLLGRKTAREKVASFLLLIHKRSMRPGGEPLGKPKQIELPITREVMATYLGLTIETVSRQMSNLKRDGIIRAQGKRIIEIGNLAALMLEAGDDDDGGFLS